MTIAIKKWFLKQREDGYVLSVMFSFVTSAEAEIRIIISITITISRELSLYIDTMR